MKQNYERLISTFNILNMAGSQNMQIKMRRLFLDYQINKGWKKIVFARVWLDTVSYSQLVGVWTEKSFLERKLFFPDTKTQIFGIHQESYKDLYSFNQ